MFTPEDNEKETPFAYFIPYLLFIPKQIGIF